MKLMNELMKLSCYGDIKHIEFLLYYRKHAMRIISVNKNSTHTDPNFQNVKFLKQGEINKVKQLKCYYKLFNHDLHEYFCHIPYLCNLKFTSITHEE